MATQNKFAWLTAVAAIVTAIGSIVVTYMQDKSQGATAQASYVMLKDAVERMDHDLDTISQRVAFLEGKQAARPTRADLFKNECTKDAECPKDFKCILNSCVPVKRHRLPTDVWAAAKAYTLMNTVPAEQVQAAPVVPGK